MYMSLLKPEIASDKHEVFSFNVKDACWSPRVVEDMVGMRFSYEYYHRNGAVTCIHVVVTSGNSQIMDRIFRWYISAKDKQFFYYRDGDKLHLYPLTPGMISREFVFYFDSYNDCYSDDRGNVVGSELEDLCDIIK